MKFKHLPDKDVAPNRQIGHSSTNPFKIVGEVTNWQGHPPEQVKAMKDALAKLKEQEIN